MSFLLFAVFSLLVKIFRSWYNQSKITTIHTEEISHNKTDQNPKKITSVSRNFISVSRTFFHTGRMCFGESPLFSSFVYHLLSRQYPSFCTAVPIGQKNFVYRRRYLYPCSISASIYSFLDRNRMSDACRSAGSFKF